MATKYVLNKTKLATFLRNVRQELLNIQSGEPKWRTGPALHFEAGKSVPIFATLDRFQDSPTKKTFDAFIAQASQDLGKPTGDGFAVWGQPLWNTVTEKDEPVVVSKSFGDAIKDSFYDCFRTAHISLDQKQVDRLAVASTRMADSIEAQISKAVSVQLEALVKRLKRVEKNDD